MAFFVDEVDSGRLKKSIEKTKVKGFDDTGCLDLMDRIDCGPQNTKRFNLVFVTFDNLSI